MPIDGNRVGLSADARTAIFHMNPDRFMYRTASGIGAEIPVALPTPIDWGSGRDMTLQSMRYLTMTHVFNHRVRVLDMTNGQARDLVPGHLASNAPAWSPDGRRVAVLTGSGSHPGHRDRERRWLVAAPLPHGNPLGELGGCLGKAVVSRRAVSGISGGRTIQRVAQSRLWP